MNADDVRKVLDSVFDKLSPAKAQEIAKGLLGEDRREQAQKLAGDLMESAQRNRDKVKELISREVSAQTKNMGVATQAEVDALKKRVRELERATGVKPAAKKPTAAKKTAAKTTAAKRSSAKKTTAARRGSSSTA
jgi:polyhydroxyalkanoate synthesis regulator phasin